MFRRTWWFPTEEEAEAKAEELRAEGFNPEVGNPAVTCGCVVVVALIGFVVFAGWKWL